MSKRHQGVWCSVCGLVKKPIGRDAPAAMANSLCDHECEGYRRAPLPGTLWPGEVELCGCGAEATRNVEGVGPCCDVHYPNPTPEQERAAALRAAKERVCETSLTADSLSDGVAKDSDGILRYVAAMRDWRATCATLRALKGG